MDPLEIVVRTPSKHYPIYLGADLLDRFATQLTHHVPEGSCICVTDEIVAVQCRAYLEALSRNDRLADTLVLEPGEALKDLNGYRQIARQLLSMGVDRQATILVLGGGVIGDVAGFVAATYMRGLRMVQVPTTLLAMVDSSIGGKVGINLGEAKNILGAFYQPDFVWVDLALLKTLPDRDFRSGLAEVFKYGIALDQDFFAWLEAHAGDLQVSGGDTLLEAVRRSIEIKAEIVSTDERDQDVRMQLNYGHTFAHAFEGMTGFTMLKHGEAVMMGMLCGGYLSLMQGYIDESTLQRIEKFLAPYLMKIAETKEIQNWLTQLKPSEVIRYTQYDKKRAESQLRFVLLTRLGACDVVGEVSEDALIQTITDFKSFLLGE